MVNDNSAMLDVFGSFSSSVLCSYPARVHLLAHAAKLVSTWVCAQDLGCYLTHLVWSVNDLQELGVWYACLAGGRCLLKAAPRPSDVGGILDKSFGGYDWRDIDSKLERRRYFGRDHRARELLRYRSPRALP